MLTKSVTLSSFPTAVDWNVDVDDLDYHYVTDASGLGLFDSGQLGAGDWFSYKFTSAGTYPIVDTIDGADSSVAVPPKAPATAPIHKRFSVAWSRTNLCRVSPTGPKSTPRFSGAVVERGFTRSRSRRTNRRPSCGT
jgi:hypothetical protein